MESTQCGFYWDQGKSEGGAGREEEQGRREGREEGGAGKMGGDLGWKVEEFVMPVSMVLKWRNVECPASGVGEYYAHMLCDHVPRVFLVPIY